MELIFILKLEQVQILYLTGELKIKSFYYWFIG